MVYHTVCQESPDRLVSTAVSNNSGMANTDTVNFLMKKQLAQLSYVIKRVELASHACVCNYDVS